MSSISKSLIDKAAKSLVSEADERVRVIMDEERTRLAVTFKDMLPYIAVSAITGLATTYFVPKGNLPIKVAGYLASVVIGGAGFLNALESLERPPAPPEPKTTSIPLVSNIAQDLAQAAVREAEPRVRSIVSDERERLSEAANSFLPWGAGAAATFFGTMFLVPDRINEAKMAGYTVSATLALYGTWKSLEVIGA